jgi:hypothetical protein
LRVGLGLGSRLKLEPWLQLKICCAEITKVRVGDGKRQYDAMDRSINVCSKTGAFYMPRQRWKEKENKICEKKTNAYGIKDINNNNTNNNNNNNNTSIVRTVT